MRGRAVSVVIGLAVALAAPPVAADAATAEALFREGRRLLEEGDLQAACAGLGESQAQDPSSGTLINLALCHERQNMLATAWAEYLAAVRLARGQGRQDRADVAGQKAAELEPKLGRVRITVEHAVEGMKVTRGVDDLGAGALGTAVPADAGSHVVRAIAPGHQPWSATITVVDGETVSVEIPRLQADATPAPVVVPPEVAPLPDVPSSHRTVGIVSGAVGLAAIGVGVGFGVSSLASYADAERRCPTRAGCSEEARSARDRAEAHAWVANITLGVGLVGLAAGAYFLLSQGGTSRTALSIRPGASGATVSMERSF